MTVATVMVHDYPGPALQMNGDRVYAARGEKKKKKQAIESRSLIVDIGKLTMGGHHKTTGLFCWNRFFQWSTGIYTYRSIYAKYSVQPHLAYTVLLTGLAGALQKHNHSKPLCASHITTLRKESNQPL